MDTNNVTWLEEVLAEARQSRLCVNPRCTTCGGAKVFYGLYVGRAAEEAGIATASEVPLDPEAFVRALTKQEATAVLDELVGALRSLGPRWASSPPVQSILTVFEPPFPFLVWGVPLHLPSRLEGTPIGAYLAELHTQAEVKADRRRALEAFNAPEAIAARRKAARKETRRTGSGC